MAGALLAALVKDFLVSARLGFTLKVYEPEVRLGDDDISREQLAGILVRRGSRPEVLWA